MPEDLTPAVTSDPLVAFATQTVIGLADGNDMDAKSVQVVEASRQDHPLTLEMLVAIGWEWKASVTNGASNPAGSTELQDAGAAQVWIEDGLNTLSEKAEVAAALATEGMRSPRLWFETLADGARVGTASLACHCHEGCEKCGTRGVVRCHTVNSIHLAKWPVGYKCATPCFHCNQTGHQKCEHCSNGTQHIQESYWDSHANCTQYRSVQRTCTQCGGRGRSSMSCAVCTGAAVVRCVTCGGSGEVRCNGCRGHGWFTRSLVGWLKANPERKCTVAAGASGAVTAATREWKPTETLKQALVGTPKVLHGPGWVRVNIPAKLPQVQLVVAFGNIARHAFDFLGVAAVPWSMPHFLEGLLRDRLGGIGIKSRDGRPLEAITLAQGSRLTRDALDAATGGGKVPSGVPSKWMEAIRDHAFVSAVRSLRAAYDGLGTATASRVWKIAALPLLVWAAAVPALSLATVPLMHFGVPPSGLDETWAATTAAMALLPLPLAWLTAGQIARSRVRRLTGEASARRRPAQGLLAKLVPAVALVVLLGGMATRGRADLLPPSVASMLAATTPLDPEPPRSQQATGVGKSVSSVPSGVPQPAPAQLQKRAPHRP